MPKLNAHHLSLALELEDARRLEAIRERDGITLTAQIRKGVALWLEQKEHERAILDAAHHRKEITERAASDYKTTYAELDASRARGEIKALLEQQKADRTQRRKEKRTA